MPQVDPHDPRAMNRSRFQPYALLAVSGVTLAFCFPTYHLFYLVWVALAPMLVAAWSPRPAQRPDATGHGSPRPAQRPDATGHGNPRPAQRPYATGDLHGAQGARPAQRPDATGRAREAARIFFLTGWVFHTLLLQWLCTNIFWAGGWAIIGQQLVCFYLSIYWGLLGVAWVWVRGALPRVPGALVLAVLWVAMEGLQAVLFSGFGWSALGYSQGPDLAFLQLASVGGVSLLSGVLVAVNALVAEAWCVRERRLLKLAAAGGIVLAAHGAGWLLLAPAGPASFQVGLYQSNYSQEMKWDRDFSEEMVARAAEQSRRLAQMEAVDLFVWPEALVMDDYRQPELLQVMQDLSRDTGVPLFTGVTRLEGGNDFNSSILVEKSGEITGIYDKVHLAPFGEYVPLNLPFIDQVVPGGVAKGDHQKVLAFDSRHLGPLICFEVLFSGMADQLRRLGADVLVVVTNLAWFGASNAVPQELEIARLRAVETRLPLIHSSNTGISGVFDPFGRFTVVNAIIAKAAYHKWPGGELDPMRTRNQRMVGALAVAAPVRNIVPRGPVVAPWVAVGLSVVLLGGALAARRRAAKTGSAQ